MDTVMIRRPFDRVSSPLFWALFLDSLDPVFIAASALLGTIFFPLGFFRDLALDIVRFSLSESIFDAPFPAATQVVDSMLPSMLQMCPPNTLALLYLEHPQWLRKTNKEATLSMKARHLRADAARVNNLNESSMQEPIREGDTV